MSMFVELLNPLEETTDAELWFQLFLRTCWPPSGALLAFAEGTTTPVGIDWRHRMQVRMESTPTIVVDMGRGYTKFTVAHGVRGRGLTRRTSKFIWKEGLTDMDSWFRHLAMLTIVDGSHFVIHRPHRLLCIPEFPHQGPQTRSDGAPRLGDGWMSTGTGAAVFITHSPTGLWSQRAAELHPSPLGSHLSGCCHGSKSSASQGGTGSQERAQGWEETFHCWI